MYEIIWHGRGGQGVVMASEILAEAAYFQGYKGVTSAPTFGPERRGAPLTASTRIADEPIRTFSQIVMADIVVVLDESIFRVADVTGRLRDGGILIVNSPKPPDRFRPDDKPGVLTATVDAVPIARECGLSVGGAPVVNTPLLGSLVRAWNTVRLESIERGLTLKMSASGAYDNVKATRLAYERTVLGERTNGTEG
jgi:2-oxoacid:acceptor oxidoreductase gamma subunit (pyruvate/2-ketoisovalerate family)